MTAGIKRRVKQTDKLHWNVTLLDFFRQEVKREIWIAENKYVCSELLKCNEDTNSIWKITNHYLPNRKPPLTSVSNRLNDFYVSVGETAAANANTICEQYGFSAAESVERVKPTTDDLQNIEF